MNMVVEDLVQVSMKTLRMAIKKMRSRSPGRPPSPLTNDHFK